MVTIKTTAGRMKSMLSMMALPSSTYGDLFPNIAPTLNPPSDGTTGSLTINLLDKAVMVVASFINLDISGITEPTKIPIRVKEVLNVLSLFQDNEEITYIQDSSQGVSRIVGLHHTPTIPIQVMDECSTTVGTLPLKFDTDGIPLYKGGTVRPSIQVDIPQSVLQSQMSSADLIKADPRIFYWGIEENSFITKVGNPSRPETTKIKSKWEPILLSTNNQPYESKFAAGFENIFKNLTGNLSLYLVTNGPAWIVSDSPDHKVSYMLSPALE